MFLRKNRQVLGWRRPLADAPQPFNTDVSRETYFFAPKNWGGGAQGDSLFSRCPVLPFFQFLAGMEPAMLRVACGSSFVALVLLLAGCDGPAAATGPVPTTPISSPAAAAPNQAPAGHAGVAVIDLDEVAARLGRDVEIINEVKNKEAQLNQELDALRTSYSNQVEDKRRELELRPSAEQTKKLQVLDRDLGAKLQQAQLDAQRELIRHQNSLITRLRESVKPVARNVAASRGLKMVVAKNEDVVFTFDASLDITNEVVEKLLEQGLAAAPTGNANPPPAPTYPPSSTPQPPAPRTAEQFQLPPQTQQR